MPKSVARLSAATISAAETSSCSEADWLATL